MWLVYEFSMLYFCLVWFIFKDVVASSDVFASSAGIKRLIDNENRLAEALDSTIKNEEKRIENLKRLRDEMSQSYKKLEENGIGDVDKYISNPLNAYFVIKRYATDWGQVKDAVNNVPVEGKY